MQCNEKAGCGDALSIFKKYHIYDDNRIPPLKKFLVKP